MADGAGAVAGRGAVRRPRARDGAARPSSSAATTVDIELQGDANVALGDVLDETGDAADAEEARAAALERYERKGDRGVGRAGVRDRSAGDLPAGAPAASFQPLDVAVAGGAEDDRRWSSRRR